MDEQARPLIPQELGIGQLFWTIADAVVVADVADDRIVLWNPAAERLLGYSEDEALGQSIGLLVPEKFRAQHRVGIARYLATGHGELIDRQIPVELTACCKDGGEVSIELTLSPIERPQVEGRFVLAIIRDVTERRRAENQRLALVREQNALEQAQLALRVRDELLSAIAHDLRGPLTTIRARAQLALRRLWPEQGPDRQRLAADFTSIVAATGKMTGMIDELLDVTRLEAGRPLELERRPTDLVELVEQVVAPYRQPDATHRVVVESEATKLVGIWDRFRLERVVANLLSNAVKYSPPESEITVRLACDERDGVPWARLSVRDRGMGIPTADLTHIFERFHRASNVAGRVPGTGIGLAASRQIVEQHGGTICLQSEEGEGTTVTVCLPLISVTAGEESGERPAESASH